jgi:outer membrane protein assembly factor BamB
VGVLLGGFLFVFTNRSTTTALHTNSQSGGLLIETSLNANSKSLVIAALHTPGGAVAWTYNIPAPSSFVTSKGSTSYVNAQPVLVVSDGIVYANSANHMYVLNAQTGTLLWQKTLPGNNSSTQAGAILLAVDQDLLSVVSGNSAQPSTFYALNKQNGQIIWHHSMGYNHTFTVSNGVVYLEQSPTSAYGPGAIVALHESDGQQLWSAPVADPFSLLVAGNVLYAQTAHQQTPSDLGGNKENKRLVALNTANGTLLWSVSLVNDGASNLAFSNNMILLYRQTNQPQAAQFCAYRSSDGSQAWCTSGKEGPWDENTSTYMVANDTLYVSFLATTVDRSLAEPSNPGMAVEALNPQTGHASWSINLSNATTINAMTIAQKTLYLLENGKIVALDSATGQTLWTIAAGNGAQTLNAVNS